MLGFFVARAGALEGDYSLQLRLESWAKTPWTAANESPRERQETGSNACWKLPCHEKSEPSNVTSREILGAAAEHGTREVMLIELQLQGMQCH